MLVRPGGDRPDPLPTSTGDSALPTVRLSLCFYLPFGLTSLMTPLYVMTPAHADNPNTEQLRKHAPPQAKQTPVVNNGRR